MLEPLAADDVGTLIDNLAAGLGERAREKIAEAAEGNPLFVEEMLAMVSEDGDEPDVPPTIHALLEARLDRLEPPERDVLGRASIEGKVFHAGAVATLAPDELRPDVTGRLVSLVRKELIRPDRSELAGEDAFRFRHLLIRDAAYQSLPKQARAELHERFAGWLEGVVAETAQYLAIVGYHLRPGSTGVSSARRATSSRRSAAEPEGGSPRPGRGHSSRAICLPRRTCSAGPRPSFRQKIRTASSRWPCSATPSSRWASSSAAAKCSSPQSRARKPRG